jgi:hypothetical protein
MCGEVAPEHDASGQEGEIAAAGHRTHADTLPGVFEMGTDVSGKESMDGDLSLGGSAPTSAGEDLARLRVPGPPG